MYTFTCMHTYIHTYTISSHNYKACTNYIVIHEFGRKFLYVFFCFLVIFYYSINEQNHTYIIAEQCASTFFKMISVT